MAELTISPDEIRDALQDFVKAYEPGKASTTEVGYVVDAADGIAHVEGLPGVMANELIRNAASLVADEADLAVATITTATPLSAEQLDRLRAGLAKNHGRDLKLNLVIDPAVLGGIRVQIGDDVIDGSVSTKITELRLRLAS